MVMQTIERPRHKKRRHKLQQNKQTTQDPDKYEGGNTHKTKSRKKTKEKKRRKNKTKKNIQKSLLILR